MAKKKSESRQLAELVAKQRGIKVKSAQRFLQRLAKGEIKKPDFSGFSSYAKTKVRKFAAKPKAVAKAKTQLGIRAIMPDRNRVFYRDYETVTIGIDATYNFYGSDVRKRQINFRLKGDEASKILNAPDVETALERLKQTREGAFLQGADIQKLEKISLGNQTLRSDFWD